ncbi:hypothetical protein WJX79_004686 [Trebouxia sp. C0005]
MQCAQQLQDAEEELEQVHQVTAKLEQQVSPLTAALEDSKQREGLTAHKLSRCEQQLQTAGSCLREEHEEHELHTQLKQEVAALQLNGALASLHQVSDASPRPASPLVAFSPYSPLAAAHSASPSEAASLTIDKLAHLTLSELLGARAVGTLSLRPLVLSFSPIAGFAASQLRISVRETKKQQAMMNCVAMTTTLKRETYHIAHLFAR